MALIDPSQEFFRLAVKWAPFFRSVLNRAIFLKGDRDWTVHMGVRTFRPYPVVRYDELDVSTPQLRAFRDLKELTPETSDKAITEIHHFPSRYAVKNFVSELSPMWLGKKVHLINQPANVGDIRMPVHELDSAVQVNIPADLIDLELLSTAPPYDGYQELAFDLNFSPEQPPSFGKQHVTTVLIPPLVVSRQLSSLRDNTLVMDFGGNPAVDASKIVLGLKIYKNAIDAPIREKRSIASLDWRKEGVEDRAITVLQLDEAISVQVVVLYDDEYVGRFFLRDPGKDFSDLIALHRAIDPQFQLAEKFFSSQDAFEDCVSVLLELMGLSVLHYGGIPFLSDGADMLALSKDRFLFVIEATSGAIDRRNKLYKLNKRTNEIREHYSKHHSPPVAILPIVITSLEREETRADWADAIRWGIAVLGRAEIQNLLSLAKIGGTGAQFFELAQQLVPRNDKGTESQQQLDV